MTALANPPSLHQRDRALKSADAVKDVRFAVRSRMRQVGRAGARELAELIEANEPALCRAYVWQVVQWVPQIGDVKAADMLRVSGIDPWHRVGRLTARQRTALGVELGRHADGLPVSLPMARRNPNRPRKPEGEPGVRVSGPMCSKCGEWLIEASESGKCGFCEAGL